MWRVLDVYRASRIDDSFDFIQRACRLECTYGMRPLEMRAASVTSDVIMCAYVTQCIVDYRPDAPPIERL